MPLDCRRDGDPGLSCELRARWIHLYPAEQDSFLTSRSTVPQPTFTQLPPIVPYSMRAICAPCSAAILGPAGMRVRLQVAPGSLLAGFTVIVQR